MTQGDGTTTDNVEVEEIGQLSLTFVMSVGLREVRSFSLTSFFYAAEAPTWHRSEENKQAEGC